MGTVDSNYMLKKLKSDFDAITKKVEGWGTDLTRTQEKELKIIDDKFRRKWGVNFLGEDAKLRNYDDNIRDELSAKVKKYQEKIKAREATDKDTLKRNQKNYDEYRKKFTEFCKSLEVLKVGGTITAPPGKENIKVDQEMAGGISLIKKQGPSAIDDMLHETIDENEGLDKLIEVFDKLYDKKYTTFSTAEKTSFRSHENHYESLKQYGGKSIKERQMMRGAIGAAGGLLVGVGIGAVVGALGLAGEGQDHLSRLSERYKRRLGAILASVARKRRNARRGW